MDIPASRFLPATCPQCGFEGHYAYHWDDDEVPATCPECEHSFEISVPMAPAATEGPEPE
jgi:hypothetical protein